MRDTVTDAPATPEAADTDTARRPAFDAIAVVGLGLIGASLSAAITEAFPDAFVMGVDVDARARELAEQRGWAARAVAPDRKSVV